MSLLMEALKKAEREKLKLENATLGGEDDTTLPPLPAEEAVPAAPPPDAAPTTAPEPEPAAPVETAAPEPLVPQAPSPVVEPASITADLSLELLPPATAPAAPARDFDTVAHAIPPVETAPPAPEAPVPPPVQPAAPAQEPIPAPAPKAPAPPPQAARKPEPPRKPASPHKAAAVFSAGKAPAGRLRVPRPVLLAGIATLVAVGMLGIGGYYYWQLSQPVAPLLPPAAPPMQPAPVAAQSPVPPPEGLAPVASALPEPSPPAAPKAAPGVEAASPGGSGAMPPESAAKTQDFSPENPAIRIQRASTPASVDPSVASAYQAFLAGNLAEATQDYGRTLKRSPNNRDALLGMAAIRARQGQTDEAAALYTRLLELDPRDAEAQAGLVTLSRNADPVQSESRLKGLLGQVPDSDFLHFALGNLYAGQSRWAEAQQSYFRAFQKAPANPDYAYNLAVSLDHLEQAKLAIDYYRRALKLAAGRPHGFNRDSAESRIEALGATLPAPTAESTPRPAP